MRTAATGFLLGYLTIALVIAPALLCALDITPSYSDGVRVVLNRTGVSPAIQRYGTDAEDLRDRFAERIARYVASRL
jgi:hypothetical protein